MQIYPHKAKINANIASIYAITVSYTHLTLPTT